MDISTKTIEELKQIGYDLFIQSLHIKSAIEENQNNLAVVQARILQLQSEIKSSGEEITTT